MENQTAQKMADELAEKLGINEAIKYYSHEMLKILSDPNTSEQKNILWADIGTALMNKYKNK
jgi:hypothetical protein